MPRFCRFLFGPLVITRPQVIRGAISPGQQCWMGRRARSTSLPSQTISWHFAPRNSFGDMSHTDFTSEPRPSKSLKSFGGSGSFRRASTWPILRNSLTSSAPMPSATRRVVPNRLPSTGMSYPVGLLNSKAGPPARKVRSHTSVISKIGEIGVEIGLSSPICCS